MTTDSAKTARFHSIDILRGAVMVLMAIDHVRVYSGLPAGGATPGIFFTRWVTHFCAPVFVFLAGTSAFLYGSRLADPRALSRFLLTRGLLLVVLELTLIRFSWTFNVDYASFTLAGVIWMLGWSMVLLAALVHFSPKTVGIVGIAVMAFQQLFQLLGSALPPSLGTAWHFLYPNSAPQPESIAILYVIVPWVGVMAAGYGFGALLQREDAERRRLCLRIGLGATAAFLAAGTAMVLTHDVEPGAPPALFRLLNQGKYPPTQLFLLMTLGPAIALLPLAERARGWFADALATFGRAPLFYYLLHLPLIHAAALVVNRLREGSAHQEWYASAPFARVPPEHQWSLMLLYLVFAACVAVLYPACRWYANEKATRPRGWMRFI